jgi:DNA invertase Pin-like site-specific DNA recombinase
LGLGVTRQLQDCEELIRRRGWVKCDQYIDNDISAFSGKRRPEYERLLEDVRNGAVRAIAVWQADRLHRSPRELEDFIDLLEKTGCIVATVTGGDRDFTTSTGRWVARMEGVNARRESELKSERIKRKKLEMAEKGIPAGGSPRPFGYERDRLTIREDEALLLRSAAKRRIAGASLLSIVREWTAAGVPTVTGAPWKFTTLKGILVNPRVAGLRAHKGTIIGPAAWPPILDRATWERLCVVLNDQARRRIRTPRRYFLTGILSCGACQRRLASSPRTQSGTSRRAYGCRKELGGCGNVHITADPLEEWVAELVIQRLEGPALAQALKSPDDDGESVLAAIAAEEAKLLEYADDYDAGRITRGEWMRLRDRVEERLSVAHRQLQRATPVQLPEGIAAGALRIEWPALPFDARRALVASLIDRIEVQRPARPANRFKPERLSDPIWKV